eukprot:COSAG01_NODE_937_length_12628_cov_12.665257_19_plen_443_part_00
MTPACSDTPVVDTDVTESVDEPWRVEPRGRVAQQHQPTDTVWVEGSSWRAVCARLDALEAATAWTGAAEASAEQSSGASGRVPMTAEDRVRAAAAEGELVSTGDLAPLKKRLWFVEEKMKMVTASQGSAEQERSAYTEDIASLKHSSLRMAEQMTAVAESFVGAMADLTETLGGVAPALSPGPSPFGAGSLQSSRDGDAALETLKRRVDDGARLASVAVRQAAAARAEIERAEAQARAQLTQVPHAVMRARVHEAQARGRAAEAEQRELATQAVFEDKLRTIVAAEVSAALAAERSLQARRKGLQRGHAWQERTRRREEAAAAAVAADAVAAEGVEAATATGEVMPSCADEWASRLAAAREGVQWPGGIAMKTADLMQEVEQARLLQEAETEAMYDRLRLQMAIEAGKSIQAEGSKPGGGSKTGGRAGAACRPGASRGATRR